MVTQLEQSIRNMDCSEGTTSEIATAAVHLLGAKKNTAMSYLNAKRRGFSSYKLYYKKNRSLSQKRFEKSQILLTPIEIAEAVIYSDFQEEQEKREEIQEIFKVLNYLPARWKYIIEQRYFEEKTMEEIGNELQITKQRVHQLEQRALEEFKTQITA